MDNSSVFKTGLIEMVREGMHVIDADGKDIFDTDRYLRADVVERIEGDKLFLKLPKDRLAVESGDDLANVQPSHRVPAGDRRIVMPPPAAGLGLPNQGNNT